MTMESSSLYFNATVVSIVAIAVTSLVYVFCHFVRTRAPQKTRLYGRIQEIPYRAGPKKKIVRIDPFSVTGLDMLRRFEDALANFLYSFCNEVALSRLDSYRIVFTGQQDRGIARHDVDQYKLEYFWILNHLYSNAREYAYLFTATRDKNVKDAVFKLRSSPLSVAELKSALETSKGPPYRVEVIHSLGWQIRNICGELTAEANERENGVHILEGFDSTNKDVRHRIRSSILHTMDKGSNLVEILRTISPNTSKVIKDHYSIVVKIFSTVTEEYLSYSDLVLHNRKCFQEMDSDTRKEAIVNSLDQITSNAYNEEIWEILAVTVLPRFRKSLS